MGFGLIFSGFATLLSFKVIPAGIIGCLLMFKGLSMLSEYGEDFARARKACTAFLVYFILFGILWVLNLTGIFRFTDHMPMVYADELIYYVLLSVFCFFLYRALGNISRQVGFEKGSLREKRGISLIIVFALFTALRLILSAFGMPDYLRLPLVLFELFWLIYSLIYIYSCYMMIATQEIIDDEQRKMREYDEKYSFRKLKGRQSKK